MAGSGSRADVSSAPLPLVRAGWLAVMPIAACGRSALHVRVGLDDSLWIGKGELASSNA